MKIEKLVIYGFGKHENVTIELGRTMNVLYGHNEAGKTTIQQFILHILFGFPQRNSTILRYEPKTGGKYGGQIHIEDQQYGKCIIERIGGKSAGDVTVYYENGELGGEEQLNRLLRQYDRASFESIFAFSLLQLQGFEKMDEQTLSRTLLASGTTGVDDLLQVEAKLEKEMEQLFKKSGRNPVLNVKLNELRTLELQLQEEQQKLEHYAPAIHRIQEVEEELTVLQKRKKVDENRHGEVNTMRQILPLYMKRESLTDRYMEIKDWQFPTDGIQRYETYRNRLAEANARLLSIQEELERIEHQLADEIEEQKQAKLEQLIANEAEWHRWQSSAVNLKNEFSRLKEQKARLLARLGLQTSDSVEILIRADVSIRKEEELYELLEQMRNAHQEIEIIESKLAATRGEIDALQEKVRSLTPPSDEDLTTARQWPEIQKRLAEAKAYRAFNKQKQTSSKTMGIIMLVLILLLAGYGIIEKQFGLLLLSSILAAVAFFLLKRSVGDNEVEKMRKLLSTYEGREQKIEAVVTYVGTYEQQKKQLQENMMTAESENSRLEMLYDEKNDNNMRTEELLQTFLANYGIDGLPSASIIPELFRMIRETQEVIRNLDNVYLEQQRIDECIRKRMKVGEHVLQQSVPEDALYEFIRKAYRDLLQDIDTRQTLEKKKARLHHNLKETTTLVHLLKEQIAILFTETNVANEEAYYQAHKIQQEKQLLTEQLANIDMQLKVYGDIEMSRAVTDLELAKISDELKEKIEHIDAKINGLLDEKAKLVNETNQLLSDETYGDLQQQFEVERAKFLELAKKWASKKALATAIRQMMSDLKEKKFPQVLQNAEVLFNKLTGGQYETMQLTEQGYFEVISKDGIRYPIIELSQATKEQAYISLRLALASSVFETAPFPIIMDDPFVHFDASRLSHIIEVLDQLKEHQIIYFTCHTEMKNRWHEATIINVSDIGNKQGAKV